MDSIHHSFFTVKYLEVLTETYPCPECGQLARRNSKGERTFPGLLPAGAGPGVRRGEDERVRV